MKIYLTRKGFEKMQAELRQILSVDRPEIVKVVSWAASNGDRSENADYLYGKRKLRELDRRIRFLSSRLEQATVVDPGQVRTDRVQFGATVELECESGESKKIQIVGVDEVDPSRGQISFKSPLGSALLGKSAGETVLVKSPGGEFEWEILKVLYVEN